MILGLVSCSTFTGGVSEDGNLIKRSWVRRLASSPSLMENEQSQNFSPLILENGNILQGSTFGKVFEISPYGRILWSYDSGTSITTNGSVFQNFIFFGGQNKKVYAYNRESNEVLWSITLEDSPAAISDFNNGSIFVSTAKGNLYAIEASDGSIEWKVSQPSAKLLSVYGSAKPLLFNNNVIASFPDGSVAAYSMKNGKKQWSVKLSGSQKYNDADFLILTDDSMLFAGTFNEALYRINPDNGQILWQAFEKPVQEPSSYGGKLFFPSAGGRLLVLNAASGKLIKKEKKFIGLGSPILVNAEVLISVDSKGPIYLMDKTTKVVDRYELISSVSAKPVFSKNKRYFYVLSDKGYLYSFTY